MGKALIILGQVIYFWFRKERRFTRADSSAVQIGRTINFEGEIDAIVTGIDIGQVCKTQSVVGKITIGVQFYDRKIVMIGIWIDDRVHILDPNAGYSLTAFNSKVSFKPRLVLL